MTWKIDVDQHSCIASGMCAGIAPDVFALDDEFARALADEIQPNEVVLDAADSCPAMAITVTEALSDEVLGPRQ
ncbi:ferredoxin [Amycolatopsis nigrescens]|uniref:ferredoxin n=1 Tax=Amycolatopsis nigrescens TaxID=381445 RepID=UPI00035F22BF|nr:ferredoxin [Amycolatopsis nigrescens]